MIGAKRLFLLASDMRAFLFGTLVCFVSSTAVWATDVRLAAPGAGPDLAEELRAASLTLSIRERPTTTLQDLLAAARADYARLIAVLYAQGYYSPIVAILVDGREAAELAPFEAPPSIDRIELRVTPGPRFVFGRALVTPLAPGTELPAGFAIGKTARSTVIVDAAEAGVDGWRIIGHAKARVAGQTIVADHRRAELEAEIKLDPGPRLRFGKLLIAGKTRTKPERIREIAGLPEGEVFAPEALDRSAERLRKSGAFRSVVLHEADTIGEDGTLDVTAQLVDEKKRRLGFGAELSSFEGLGVTAFWMHRNLFRGAERLRIEGEASGIGGDSGGIDFRFDASLTRPATFTPDTSLRFGGTFEVLDEPDFFERTIGVEAVLLHQYSDDLELSAGVGIRYSEVNDDLGARSFTQLTFPLGATLDRRDNALDATAGYYTKLELEPFLELSGNVIGGRIFADARAYRHFGSDGRFVVAGRVQAGSIVGADLAEVPSDMLFFSGGGGTVRGQPYQSLGVDLPGGKTVGGRGFIGASAELRMAVSERIGVVGFADAGSVTAESIPGRNGRWHSGAGLGLRYETGIGPIRFDAAVPVGGSTGDGLQIYIGIGQAF